MIEEIYWKLRDDYELFFYRTQKGAECDLVLCQNRVPKIAIEIKLTNAPKVERGLTESPKDLETTRNFIVTHGSERFALANNIEVIGFEELMEVLG